jgi:hypothetical protein
MNLDMAIKIILINETDYASARLPGLLASWDDLQVSGAVFVIPCSAIE